MGFRHRVLHAIAEPKRHDAAIVGIRVLADR
jgi:hypothetical protein